MQIYILYTLWTYEALRKKDNPEIKKKNWGPGNIVLNTSE